MPLERATLARYEHSLSHAYADAELAEEQLSDEPEIYCEDVLINFSDFAGDSEMCSSIVSVRVFACVA